MSDPKPRRMTPRMGRRLTKDFMAGLSFVGLARKYGFTTQQVQEAVRVVMIAREWERIYA